MSALPKHDLRIDSLPEKLAEPRLITAVDEEGTGDHSQHAEKLNFQTHALGMIASCIAGFYLIKISFLLGDNLQIIGSAVFAATMISVYTCSTLSHGPFSHEWRHRFRTCDQVSIFLFIAGSFTPFVLTYMRSPFGWSLLGMSWSLALIGAAAKLFLTKREMVSIWFYVLQAWAPSLSLIEMAPHIPLAGTIWIVAGGLAYTGGVYFLMNDHKAKWYHAVWHLSVVAGTTCHFIVVLFYILPWK